METAGHLRLDKTIGSASKLRRITHTSARAVDQDLFDAFLSWKTSSPAQSFDQDSFDAVLSSIYSPQSLEALDYSPVSESRNDSRFVEAAPRRVADACFNRMRPLFCALN
jgi:hypothetical protein